MAKRLIISIDGGGIRGIIPLVLLRYIQFRIKKDLGDLVSKWYGTSTGSIIATGLLVQQETEFAHAIQNVLDIYEFRSTAAINPLGASDSARALNKLLDENFGYFSVKDFPKLNVVTCELPSLKTVVFNAVNDVNLAQALKASCAVPGIFESVTIGSKKYVDGFLSAKNPAELAIQNELVNDDLILLSLGTGILREEDEIELSVKKTHENLEVLSKKNGFNYFRFNPRLNLASDDMQNTSLKNIFNLKKDTENYLKEKKEKLDDLVKVLSDI